MSRLIFLTLVVTILLVRPASADNFLFSITPDGANSGSPITGEIVGLASSGASTPTDIIIYTQPAGYTYGPEDLIANGYQFLTGQNTFTVTAGVITGADLAIYKLIGTQGDVQGYGFNVNYAGYTGASGIFQSIGNVGGSGGTVTADFNNGPTGGLPGMPTTPVPEPRQTTLIFLLAGVCLLVGRKLSARTRGPSLQPTS